MDIYTVYIKALPHVYIDRERESINRDISKYIYMSICIYKYKYEYKSMNEK